MYKLLIVDDDLKMLKATQSFLNSNNYEVKTCSSPSEALELLKKEEFALALFDYQMPEMMGDTLASLAHQANPNQQIAMYSCDLSREALKNSMRAGALDFVDKSLAPPELLATVASFCNRYEEAFRTIRPEMSKSENRKLIESVGMVGQSQASAELATRVQKFAAASDTSVLICGESGTGKELVAKALHKLSSRAKGNFVAINCAAIPRELLESELFGHKKGSFTGAIADKVGKFEFANHGTIFLDEIGDMPMELQVKLLRVLQEREIIPVGARNPQKINVRIICATHRNLATLIANGTFREDLFYRINVVHVEIPPLRSRVDDIEPLVAHFTDRYNKKSGKNKFFQRRTLDVFKRYAWPGNVRELEGMVEQHLVISDESMIGPSDLDLKLYGNQVESVSGLTFSKFREMKRSEETDFLKAALQESGGNKTEASRRLDITPNHLRHLLHGSR
ncbi:MAG: sigma-54 dependent transcriptional regulator [Pseudomonadota bacterium]|nr:sigma-54 dependent transcriptional regulator [Pseudomonadota bacterium]